MVYKIAIPSYNRHSTLKTATLSTLHRLGISPRKIHIFVANKEQKKIYKQSLPKEQYNKIIIGIKGMKNVRNYMNTYFKEGSEIFYMDDDIYDVQECVYDNDLFKTKLKKNENTSEKSGNILKPIHSLDTFIKKAFKELKKRNLRLFGIYPVFNAFFMKCNKDILSIDLKYIIGSCYGVINCHFCGNRTIDDKEDFERTLQYYLTDGGVLRFNNVTVKTKYYSEQGGMQSEGHRSESRVDRSSRYLLLKYPEIVHPNNRKKSAWTEVRLFDKRKNKVFGKSVLKSYMDRTPINYEEFVKIDSN